MTATTIEAARGELARYADLEKGWDLDQGVPPRKEHVAIAQKFLEALPKDFCAPTPMLGANGTIGFYWYERPFFLDVEIEQDDSLSVYIRHGNYTDQDPRNKWYPKVSLEEFVSIYVSNVDFWIMEQNGVTGKMK
jgi:hypothetical protein